MSLDSTTANHQYDDDTGVAVNEAANPTKRLLDHPVSVVFIGHSESVPLEFHSSVLASHIAQIAGDDGPAAVAVFSDGIRDDLDYLKTTIELAAIKPVLIVIREYSGAKTYRAVKQFLDERFIGVRYEALMVIKPDEVIDQFSTVNFEVDEGEGRVDAFRLAIKIIEKHTRKPCDCKNLVSELLASLTSH